MFSSWKRNTEITKSGVPAPGASRRVVATVLAAVTLLYGCTVVVDPPLPPQGNVVYAPTPPPPPPPPVVVPYYEVRRAPGPAEELVNIMLWNGERERWEKARRNEIRARILHQQLWDAAHPRGHHGWRRPGF